MSVPTNTVSRSVSFTRVGVSAGEKLGIRPERISSSVTIQNGTPDDLEVHSSNEDDAHFLVIGAGFERTLPKLHNNNTIFDTDNVAFWLKPVQTGSVVLIWT
jgi:hypothetical protein